MHHQINFIGTTKGHTTRLTTSATASSSLQTTVIAMNAPKTCPTSANKALDAATFSSRDASGLISVVTIAGLGKRILTVVPRLSCRVRTVPKRYVTSAVTCSIGDDTGSSSELNRVCRGFWLLVS